MRSNAPQNDKALDTLLHFPGLQVQFQRAKESFNEREKEIAEENA